MDIQIQTGSSPSELVVRLNGELDSLHAPTLYDKLSQKLREVSGVEKVIFDCAGLTYISSAGAGILLLSLDNFGARGISFELQKVRPEVYNILDLLGLTKVMSVSHG